MSIAQQIEWNPSDFVGFSEEQIALIKQGFDHALNLVYNAEMADYDHEPDDFMSDAEADADALRMAGMGTDEDYGLFGDFDSPWEE